MSTEETLSQIKGLDKIQSYYAKNRKPVMYFGIALIVIAAGMYYYMKVMVPNKEKAAQAEMFMAERFYAQDSTDQALYGDGFYKGFIEVADEFGGTKAGNLANYYAGRLLMNKSEFGTALEHLKKVRFHDYFMEAGTLILIGDCHSELGDYEKAGEAYMDAADAGMNDITRPKALYKAALAFEAATRYEDALEALEAIKADHMNSRQAEQIDKEIARMRARVQTS